MDDIKKYSLLLAYGTKESELLQQLSKNSAFPNNKNEIFRRGLHVLAYMAGVSESLQLYILLAALEHSPDDNVLLKVQSVKDKLCVLLAILAAKNGSNVDQFLENLLRQMDYYEDKLKKVHSEKDLIFYDSKDPFFQQIREDMRTFGHAMKRIYRLGHYVPLPKPE